MEAGGDDVVFAVQPATSQGDVVICVFRGFAAIDARLFLHVPIDIGGNAVGAMLTNRGKVESAAPSRILASLFEIAC